MRTRGSASTAHRLARTQISPRVRVNPGAGMFRQPAGKRWRGKTSTRAVANSSWNTAYLKVTGGSRCTSVSKAARDCALLA